jgi:hypothetical protein
MKQERVEAISSHPDHTPMSKRINLILWLALVLTLIQLPMYQLDSNDLISATTANLVGGVWIGAYVLIFAVLMKGRTRDKIEKNPQDALL